MLVQHTLQLTMLYNYVHVALQKQSDIDTVTATVQEKNAKIQSLTDQVRQSKEETQKLGQNLLLEKDKVTTLTEESHQLQLSKYNTLQIYFYKYVKHSRKNVLRWFKKRMLSYSH